MIIKRKRKVDEVNSSSMADIAFLLLVFFLVTTTISMDKGISLVLPAEGNEMEVNQKNIVNILINESGKILVDEKPRMMSEMKNLSKSITNYEPLIALNGGANGLDFIKKVIYKSTSLLTKNGLLAVEIGNNQYRKVSSLLRQHGFREMFKEFDYNRNVRCIISTKV